jgi:para-nitrobenzyl esterase
LFEVFLGQASIEALKPPVRQRFGDQRIDRLLAAYDQESGGIARGWVALIGDVVFRIPMLQLADAMCARTPVFVYRFDWASRGMGGRLGAAHALELPFVWDRLDLPASQFLINGEVERARPLATHMHATWAAFIRTHDLDRAAVGPAWPAYDTKRRATMLLDDTTQVADDPGATTRRLWAELLGRASD